METSIVDSPELGNILKDKKDKLTTDNEKRKLRKKQKRTMALLII